MKVEAKTAIFYTFIFCAVSKGLWCYLVLMVIMVLKYVEYFIIFSNLHVNCWCFNLLLLVLKSKWHTVYVLNGRVTPKRIFIV